YIRGLREPQMPKGSPALSEEELHIVRMWIFAGAKDDSGQLAEKSSGGFSVDASSAGAFGNDPATQRAFNTLLFSGDNNERFLARRAFRLALLPKIAEPPATRTSQKNPIDQFIVAKWEQENLKEAKQPPAQCSDTAFLRRVYLDVIGMIPTAAEAK